MNDSLKRINDFEIKGNKIVHYIGNGGSIIIPNGVDELDELNFCKYSSQGYDFETKSKITSIYIPKTVKRIHEDTFSDMVNLNRVVFEDASELREIPKYAFSGCKSLKRITIPKSVTSIDSWAFCRCSNIEVVIEGNCKVHDFVFGADDYKSTNCRIIDKTSTNTPYNGYVNFNNTNNKHDEINTTSNNTSNSIFDGYFWFKIIMFFVYFFLFVGACALSDYTWIPCIVVLILGIINLLGIIGEFI